MQFWVTKIPPHNPESCPNSKYRTKGFQCQCKVVLNGLFGEVESRCNCLIIKTHIATHLENSAALFRHLTHCKTDDKFLLLSIVTLLDRDVVRFAQRFVRKRGYTTRTTKCIYSCISRHDIDVLAELLNLYSEDLATLPNLDKDILCDILGKALRFDYTADELRHARVVVFKHDTKRSLIAIRESLDYLWIYIKCHHCYTSLQK